MKTTLILLLATLLTACAQLATPFQTSVELARQECRKIGYAPGTQSFMQCVERQAINIRNNR
jgi:hypothetical protein